MKYLSWNSSEKPDNNEQMKKNRKILKIMLRCGQPLVNTV